MPGRGSDQSERMVCTRKPTKTRLACSVAGPVPTVLLSVIILANLSLICLKRRTAVGPFRMPDVGVPAVSLGGTV